MTTDSEIYTLNTSTPTLIASGGTISGEAVEVHLQNYSTIDIYIGGSNVTSADGIKFVSSDSIWGPIKLRAGAFLYAIAASGTPAIRVLKEV